MNISRGLSEPPARSMVRTEFGSLPAANTAVAMILAEYPQAMDVAGMR